MSSADRPTFSLSLHYLPLSVIQRIFISFNTSCHRIPHSKCRRLSCRNSFPLLLGKVCREWRDIVWKLPAIWSWIDIPVPPKISDVHLQLVEEWLQRAADEPLSIIIHPAPSRSMTIYGELSPQTPRLFKLIVDYSMQWKTLDITTTEQCTEVLHPAYGRTPILESVYIHSTGMQLQKSPLEFLGDAPNLRSLHCVGIASIVEVTNPWKNLVSFTSQTSSDTTFPFLLSYAPNLRHLTMNATIYANSSVAKSATNTGNTQYLPITSDDTLTLPPHLISLVIKGSHTTQYIRRLKVPPTLQRLSIIRQGKEESIHYESFTPVVDFIDRAKCSLRSFGVSGIVLPIDAESLNHLFSKLNSVTHLYVDSKSTSNYKAMMHQIPQMLDPIPDPITPLSIRPNGVVLPKLQVLYYSTIDSGLKPQYLIDMIKHRCKGQDNPSDREIALGQFAKLKVVRFNKTNPKVVLESLQEEINEGLEFSYDLPYKGEPFE